jgi:uncharacterized membrane protein YeaQ/YmgE (transglycosylase-associated protein family)
MLAPESVFAWIIIGAIAGWLAGVLVKGYGFGLFGNIVVGILGAGVAGVLAPRLGLYTASFGGNIIASLLGALVLLFLVGLVRRTWRHDGRLATAHRALLHLGERPGPCRDACFTADATVRDEGKTMKGLAAIKAWRMEAAQKYQDTVVPLAVTTRDDLS